MASYLTISAPAEGIYREKMSKFISFAIPVSSVEEAKEEIDRIRNEYHDARHVCWAYMIGAARTHYLSSDNGEPSGTAGKPILGQINSVGVTNVVVVVVRYFGGIKLGTSGLIVAYRTAAREALDAAEIVEGKEMVIVKFSFPYLAMNDVMKITKSSSVKVIDQQFDNDCTMSISLPSDDVLALTSRLSDIPGVAIID